MKKHPNRKMHNWLVYKSNQYYLAKLSPNYKGVMYDLGAGETPYKDYFINFVDDYISVDWGGCQHQSNPDIMADLNQCLDIASDVAGTVLSLSVLEHLSEPQVMLNESFRILKTGGCLIMQVPWQWEIHEAPYDYFRYTPYGLEYLLKKAGYQEITIYPQSGFFSTWVLKFNYFTLKLCRGPKLIRQFLKMLFIPIWGLGQWVAPFVDKLDKNWLAESFGYFVVAKKQ